MKDQFKKEIDKFHEGMINYLPEYEEKYEEIKSDYPDFFELFFGNKLVSKSLFYLFKENVDGRELYSETMGYGNGYLFHYNMINRIGFVYRLINYHLLDDGGYTFNSEYIDILNIRVQSMSKKECFKDLPLDFYTHINLPPMFKIYNDYDDGIIINDVSEMLELLQKESNRILDGEKYRNHLMKK